jgi:hypothetical protein
MKPLHPSALDDQVKVVLGSRRRLGRIAKHDAPSHCEPRQRRAQRIEARGARKPVVFDRAPDRRRYRFVLVVGKIDRRHGLSASQPLSIEKVRMPRLHQLGGPVGRSINLHKTDIKSLSSRDAARRAEVVRVVSPTISIKWPTRSTKASPTTR